MIHYDYGWYKVSKHSQCLCEKVAHTAKGSGSLNWTQIPCLEYEYLIVWFVVFCKHTYINIIHIIYNRFNNYFP